MQRNGRLSKSRFLCLYLIVVVMSLFEIPVRMKQRTARVTMVSALLANKRTFRRSCNFLGSREGCRAFSSMVDSRSNDSKETCPQTPLMSHRIGIIGGGLAGLSTAYHILEKCPSADITIMDRNNPGAGGASSVAGGLLHPLSPKGKLAFRGLEGLASSNKLVSAASQFEENVVLRNKIYRIANKENQVAAFQKTAHELPEIATWVDRDASAMEDDKDLWEGEYFGREKEVLGALKLSGDCKVLHMKSYLKGLWSYCESVGSGTKTWEICNYVGTPDSVDWKEKLADYDCVVFSAGSGLFHWSILDQEEYPMTLVRGQSIEMTMKDTTTPWNAILCGKYVSPLPENGRVIIGATHEWKEKPLTPDEVEVELKERSYNFASKPWDKGTIDNITTGYRVQSNRGPNGRMPIVGKVESPHHHNSWVFTGLSGRGVLYHGIYGDVLSDLILEQKVKNTGLLETMNWWRK